MKNKFSGYWILFFVLVVILILQTGCTTTPEVEQQIETEQTEKQQSEKMKNPILCALLLKSLDCSIKEKDNAKVEYEAETHPVPVEDPVLELLIDLGEVEPDASN
jgi:hypothetical protein